MKTKAAILVELNKPLVVEEIEVPGLKDGQILVKVLASGICRSQINECLGFKGPDPFLPHLLGHEGAGIVEMTTPSVTKIKKGDYVVMTWIKGQGKEAGGSQYTWGRKSVNSGAVATLTQYAVVSENRVVKIPASVPPDQASLLGCAIPTGAGMVFNTLRPDHSHSIAVFGIGGIGASAILAAKISGCQTIVGVDISESKLQFARSIGATHVWDSARPPEEFRAHFPGFDFVIESSGKSAAMELAYRMTKDKGILIIAGNLSQGEKISIDPFDLIKGKKIIGTWGGESVPDKDIPGYADMAMTQKLPLQKLITHRFSLDDINQALEILSAGQAGRIIVEF